MAGRLGWPIGGIVENVDGTLVVSPTDLVGHLACGHLTALTLGAATGTNGHELKVRRTNDDVAVIQRRGDEHEQARLARLHEVGTVVEITSPDDSLSRVEALLQRERETIEAMASGADVVFQATFLDQRGDVLWRGHADFLQRVDAPSDLGDHSYEPEDAKLARSVKASAVLQLCHYAEQVARLQGTEPDQVHVALGDGCTESVRLAEVGAYYRAARDRFLADLDGGPDTYPLPVGHCTVCDWAEACETRREADDHLCRVAGLGREQARRLEADGIATLTALTEVPAGHRVKGIGPATVERLRRQARLQARRADGPPPPFQFDPAVEEGRGLDALPPPDPGDLFYDIEGDPFVGVDGIEYLHGLAWLDDTGAFTFQPFWAHDPRAEKKAFQDLIDLIVERRRQHPGLHIYHYAPYERTALGKLMGRHGTREDELDQLFRDDVFVDLYQVVRQGLVIGSPSYSLKKLEPLYMPARTGAITDAGSSIVEYERWLTSGDQQILDDIEAYNRDDVESTWLLRNWLLRVRGGEISEDQGDATIGSADWFDESPVVPATHHGDEGRSDGTGGGDATHPGAAGRAVGSSTGRGAAGWEVAGDVPEVRSEAGAPGSSGGSLAPSTPSPVVSDGEGLGGAIGSTGADSSASRAVDASSAGEEQVADGGDGHHGGSPGGTGAVPRSRPTRLDPEEDVDGEELLIQGLVDELLHGIDEAPGPDADADARARWLMAHLLRWHRREDRPGWWQFFSRVLEADEHDLYDDTEAIAGLTQVGGPVPDKQSLIWTYTFDPDQEHKLSEGAKAKDPATERRHLEERAKVVTPGAIVALDSAAGTLSLRRSKRSEAPHPTALIPPGPLKTPEQRASLQRLARALVDNGVDGEGPGRAARQLLGRRTPEVAGAEPGAALRRDGEPTVVAAVRLVTGLAGSHLPIQGPPGAGKTFTAAKVIVALVAQGKQVGITANSHAVIGHVLEAALEEAESQGVALHAMQNPGKRDGVKHRSVECVSSKVIEAAVAAGEVDVVAGTAWLFSRPGLAETLDTLVVDEAGQLSLANVCAVAPSARNLVLVGDPRQLAQPSQGTHPEGAGASALEHVLAGAATVADHEGLFLDRTWRLHPAITEFISEQVYDGRLESQDHCARQTVGDGPVVSGSGLRWSVVTHEGNRTSSAEEAAEVARIHATLVGRQWTDGEGKARTIGGRDILVVAPYNAQVRLLTEALPDGARVGTVDRFQGQEAAVVMVSLAASSAEDVPRGMDFLYSRNRLNVAVSRAQALAVMVASPTLLSVRCRTVAQMKLANVLCRYVEMAEPVEPPASETTMRQLSTN